MTNLGGGWGGGDKIPIRDNVFIFISSLINM